MEGGLSVAARAAEALGPAHAKQVFLTGFFSAKPFLKLHQAQTLLLHNLSSILLIILR